MKFYMNVSFIIGLAMIAFFATSCNQSNGEAPIEKGITPNRSSVVHADWTKNMVIYEVNTRNFSEGGTFKELEAHLPRLKELGVTTLWFMPVQTLATKNIKGDLGSPYALKDYESINPRLGTMDEFKSLVQKIHDLEMYVLIEWVANHTGWDHELTESHPEWYLKDSTGNFVPPKPEWEDIIELNYNNKELWVYMQDQIITWVNETDIDGFRFDVAGMMPQEFWEELKPRLDSIKPLFVFSDGPEVELTEKALDMIYEYDFLPVMSQVANGESDAIALKTYLEKEATKYPEGAYKFYFTSGHIPNSFQGTVFERLGDGAETFIVLTATLNGIPLVYSGQEAGLDKRLEFFGKDMIDWKEHRFASVYQKLFKLRADNKAMWAGEFGGAVEFLDIKNDKVLAYRRKKDENEVITILNFSSTAQTIDLEIDKSEYQNLFNPDSGTEIRKPMELQPWGYMVLFKN